MGIGPLLPWRRASWPRVLSLLRYPLIVAAVLVLVLAVAGVRQPVSLLALAACAVVVTGIVHEWGRGVVSRHRRGENYAYAFVRLLSGNRPRYGGYVVHLAIIMLAVGAIGSSFYSVQRDFNMSIGDEASLGGYTFRYVDFDRAAFADREEITAYFDLYAGDSHEGVVGAQRTIYRDFQIGATRAAIRSTPMEDFYIVPSEFASDGTAVFRVYVNPLVWWMWAAGPILVLGTLLALSPRRQPAYAAVSLPHAAQAARA